ncbi:hypothetical protein AAW51_0316 [Caldimonas brevitalea]|uniref:YhdP central domain-containing protein n=1 Tax=Caldimonas brevitalea TaxID=413882 RepID=A0A0G3BCG4_9BURK|nr:hypothetical protein AAW51_0316 [Caldimonas brevitalea]
MLAPTWRHLRTLVRVTASLVLLAWSLLLVGWLVLHWAILPRIAEWRPTIERIATRSLGVAVQIGDIRVESHGWVPTVRLRDVVVRGPDGREALRLARVDASLSPTSLLPWRPQFEQLLLEAPSLEVRRDAAGRVFVAGLEMRGGGAEDGNTAAADWFFSQQEFAIRHGRVRWVDEQRQAPPLQLDDVDLVIRNGSRLGSRRHHWRLDATPPPDWGRRFTLRGRFTHGLLARAGDVGRWSGSAYAELPQADVQRLRRHADLPIDLQQGAGAVRVWADLQRGELTALTADLALRSVDVRLGPDLQPLVLEQLTGRVSGQRQDHGWAFAAQRLAFRTGDQQVWPASNGTMRWQRPSRGRAGDGELRADRLDLAILAQLAGSLPVGAPLRARLAELRPQGQVTGLHLRWQGDAQSPSAYQAQGRVARLHLAAEPLGPTAATGGHPGRPGVAGAEVEFKLSDRGGQAQLSLNQGQLSFPGVFEDPVIGFDQLSASLEWRIERRQAAAGAAAAAAAPPPPQLELRLREAQFANADAAGRLKATWRTGEGGGGQRARRLPGVLDLQGNLTRADATRVWRYLPLGLGAPVRDYVRHAVVAGGASGVDFLVKGDLGRFPFHDAREGQFRIAAQIDDATFAYVPPEAGQPAAWPAFTQLSGRLIFDRTAMEIREARARVFGVELTQVRGGIANLYAGSVLALDGQARGPLPDALRFINETPIGDWTGKALARASGSGELQLKLGLQMPLHDLDKTAVKGTVTLPGNELQIHPDTPPLTQARATLQFTEQGFTIPAATARLFGGDASFHGGTQKDGTLRFAGQGTATAEGLRRAQEPSWLPYLGEHLSGQAAYQLGLSVVRGHPQLEITSSLSGMGIALPAPLQKPAAASWPLRVQTTALAPAAPAAAEGPMRDRLTVDVGDVLHLRYDRETAADGASTRVVAGGIGVNHAAPEPDSGVVALIQHPNLDLDAWRAAAAGLTGAGAAPAGGGGAAGSGDAAAGYAPTLVSLRAQELNVDQRRLTHVVAGLSQQADGGWRANVHADQLDGYLEYRLPRGSRGEAGGRVVARLSRLSLPESAARDVEDLLEQQPGDLPALDIVVNDFDLHGIRLGRVEVEASNRLTGEIREWRLERLALVNPDGRLDATGHWQGVAGSTARRRAVIDFQLDMADSGRLLERFGLGQVVRGGKGRLDGEISWLGSPLALDYPSLNGQFNVEVNKGQFLKAEPGIAKLAGILSLQSLPRRLTLDFRDVFQEGFAFDAFTGDVKIEQGVASSNNLRLRGVTAAVLMEGRADIARETQDLRVVVVPEINAGTASLAYAAINPAVGLGTFLAQWFLRKPLMQAGTREFRVTGPWAEPKVEPVQRRPLQPLPAGAAGAVSWQQPAAVVEAARADAPALAAGP